VKGAVVSAEQPISETGSEAVSVPARVRRILVAEDDESVARLIGIVLGKDGHEVILVGDGAAAVERAGRERFDLILLDGRMPILDGFAALRALRAVRSEVDVPIVMLTAQRRPEDMAAGFAGGVSDYLTKPFSPAQLRARVGSWLLRAEGRDRGAVRAPTLDTA
jgi:DNA-binding response OmpR family regulator